MGKDDLRSLFASDPALMAYLQEADDRWARIVRRQNDFVIACQRAAKLGRLSESEYKALAGELRCFVKETKLYLVMYGDKGKEKEQIVGQATSMTMMLVDLKAYTHLTDPKLLAIGRPDCGFPFED